MYRLLAARLLLALNRPAAMSAIGSLLGDKRTQGGPRSWIESNAIRPLFQSPAEVQNALGGFGACLSPGYVCKKKVRRAVGFRGSAMNDATDQTIYFYNQHPISCDIILSK